MNKRIFIPIAALAAVIVSLVGCSATTGEPAATTPTGVNAPEEIPGPEATPEPVPTSETETPEPEPQDATVKFGKAYTWENGVSASVSVPKAYKPKQYAAGTEGFKHFVVFTVVVINKSGTTFDPALITESVQSNDAEGSKIYDTMTMDEDLGTKILNGRQGKYRLAFGVANPKDIILEWSPGFEYNSAIWTR